MPTKKGRGKRGIVMMLKLINKVAKLNKKEEVQFDKLGIPRKNRDELVSNLGMLARSKVPVGYKHWRKDVPDRIKNAIFSDLSVIFHFTYNILLDSLYEYNHFCHDIITGKI